ncbi:hypothetical protein BH20ACT16_BH20ACT16_04360 [soil metagenome]|jgi:hypothetical protein
MTHLAVILIAATASSVAADTVFASDAHSCSLPSEQRCTEQPGRGEFFRRASGGRVPSASSWDSRKMLAERSARAYLIHAGHIPPPGRMTRKEVDVFLRAYKREHPYWSVSAGQYLQIAGRLEQGYIVAIKPSDMPEPEWIRRSGVALNVLSFIPITRMASIAKSLSSRLARVAAGGLPELRAEAQEAVARAVAVVGPGSGAAYGSRAHGALRLQILGSPNLRGEVSFLNRREVKFGTPGSIRLDIVAYSGRLPAAIFDLKTGSARLQRRG